MLIASLVLGIVALLVSWIPVLGLVLAVAGLVISIIAMKKNKEKNAMAITGLVTSIISTLIGLIATGTMIATVSLVSSASEDLISKAREASQRAAAERELEDKVMSNILYSTDL